MLKKKHTQKQNAHNLSAVTDEESSHAKLKSMEKYFTTCVTNLHNICKVLKRDCVSKNIKYNCVWYGRDFKSTSQ